MLHLTSDAGYFDPIPNCDWSFRQDDEAADEITGDVLQSKANAHADRTGKNRQRAKMNSSIVQNDENAGDQNDIADDL